MSTTKQTALRPFHETIVEAICRAQRLMEMECLATLIKATKIPKGHDEIIVAWRGQCTQFGDDDYKYDTELFGVPAYLLAQKESAAKEFEGRKNVDLDELRLQVGRMSFLFRNSRPGLPTWEEGFDDCVQKLHTLTSRVLGK